MRKIILISLSACFISLAISCSTRTAADLLISDEQEVQLGADFSKQIESDNESYPLSANTALISYIDQIGQKIVDNMEDRDTIEYHFNVIDIDTVINAFALPGGYIYVYTGLIHNAKSEDELAGVLAHELAHITMRHGAQALVRQYGASFVLDLLVGDSSALRTVMNVSAGLLFLKYGRNNELQADSCAVEYLIRGGYHPVGMQSFLEFLNGDGEGRSLTWLSTHPSTAERIEKVKDLISKKNQAAFPAIRQKNPIAQ